MTHRLPNAVSLVRPKLNSSTPIFRFSLSLSCWFLFFPHPLYLWLIGVWHFYRGLVAWKFDTRSAIFSHIPKRAASGSLMLCWEVPLWDSRGRFVREETLLETREFLLRGNEKLIGLLNKILEILIELYFYDKM